MKLDKEVHNWRDQYCYLKKNISSENVVDNEVHIKV